jgi:flagellar biosynthesis protein FliR
MTQFLGLLTALFFLAMNGHLLAIHLLAESFSVLPIGTCRFRRYRWGHW